MLFAADYRIKTIEILPVESYPAHVSVDDITIAADPYHNDEKCSTAFDVPKLASRGYFPVNIIIKNSSPYYLKIKTLNITLETRLGNRLYSTPAAMVVEEVVGQVASSARSVPKCADALFSDPGSRDCGSTCPCWRMVPKAECKASRDGSPWGFEILRQGEAPRGSVAVVQCNATTEPWGSADFANLPQCS